MIRVTAVDTETGQTLDETLEPGQYLLLCCAPADLFHAQTYPNGTVQLTVKGCTPQRPLILPAKGGDGR